MPSLRKIDSPEQLQPIYEYLQSSFGMEKSCLRGFELVMWGKKKVFIRLADLRTPDGLQVFGDGLPFLTFQKSGLKLTTIGAMHFGQWAKHNALDLTTLQCKQYYARAVMQVTPEQSCRCEPNSYVILRYLGHVVGMGFLGDAGQLASLVPKGWIT